MQNSIELDPKLLQPKNCYTRSKGNQFDFYLSGPIVEAQEYIEWFDIIRNASPADTIKIHINSPGGDLDTAIQFLRVMAESDAEIICSVEGSCMSAATMIFLQADDFEVTPHSLFMFHNYSGGTFGKGGEMYAKLNFERSWSEKFMQQVYSGFLTEEEIQSMLHNNDIWMTSEEVVTRLEAARKQAMEAAEQDTDE